MAQRFEDIQLKKQYPTLYRQLLYEIARLFVIEGKNYHEIVGLIYKWASDHAQEFYNEAGVDNVNITWVRRHILLACSKDVQFIRLGKFREEELLKTIRDYVRNADETKLEIAPNYKLLLRQVCLDLDEILIEKVQSHPEDEPVVVGVSGGHTMLALAQTLSEMRPYMQWHDTVPDARKKRVIVCSMSNGGTRDNISALSDTVAANIARELNTRARGLFVPPSFQDSTVLENFSGEPEVIEHRELLDTVSIVLTSVGNVHNDKSITRQLFELIDPSKLEKLLKKYKYLCDMLYQCFDGYKGDIVVPSPAIMDRVFSVVALKSLREKVRRKLTRCIVVASGYDKGYRALRGVIMQRMASDVYMDIDCAQGLSDIAEGK